MSPAEIPDPRLFEAEDVARADDFVTEYATGITLGDVFALAAMAAVISSQPGISFVTVAAHAYAAADAMLYQRQVRASEASALRRKEQDEAREAASGPDVEP